MGEPINIGCATLCCTNRKLLSVYFHKRKEILNKYTYANPVPSCFRKDSVGQETKTYDLNLCQIWL